MIRTLQNLDGTLLDSFFMIVSNVPLIFIISGLVVLYTIWRNRKIWKGFLFALGISLVIDLIVNVGFFKTLLVYFGIFRPRPWTIHPDIMGIGQLLTNSSFPSSHMAFTTLLVMIVSYFERRFVIFGIVIILLMWLSRVHNGMHYPTDVLIGTLMGIIYALTWLWLMKRSWLEKKHWWERWFNSF